ncbi:UNVERIFIED_ORG: acetylornithine deacetylase/succinyl-diaminopimelate desuccinylase-like protein [Buttiauxella agrestis ATCC 33320]
MKWKSVGGGSDANHTAELGIPSLDGFGPIGAGFHSTSEYLELDSIEPRIRLLKRVIQSL